MDVAIGGLDPAANPLGALHVQEFTDVGNDVLRAVQNRRILGSAISIGQIRLVVGHDQHCAAGRHTRGEMSEDRSANLDGQLEVEDGDEVVGDRRVPPGQIALHPLHLHTA
ncbi:MAG TPA: hypothetical protein VMU09_06705, partial [Acidimicrobiales bacterium]|nr:hypothetical protein [Acidimicrobiales bacterium]